MKQKQPDKTETEKAQTPGIIESSQLFGSDRRIRILHQDRLYQLTITRQNKLILTR